MDFTVIEGVVADLDRTSQVSGGGSTNATTTQIAIFQLNTERVILKSKFPAMISNGDHLRLSGIKAQGQFTAIACKNLTTGWSTSFKRQGCATTILIIFTLIGLCLTWIFPLAIIFPVMTIIFLLMIIKADSNYKRAHFLLQ